MNTLPNGEVSTPAVGFSNATAVSYAQTHPDVSAYLNVFPEYTGFPEELVCHNNVLLWLVSPKKNAKPSKIPCDQYLRRCGANEKTKLRNVNDVIAQWNTYLNSGDFPKTEGGKVAGIGVAFADEYGIVALDIDKSVSDWDGNTGKLSKEAGDIATAADGLVEISCSATGIHMFFNAPETKLDQNRKGNIELYTRDRYFALTGVWAKVTQEGEGYALRRVQRPASAALPAGGHALQMAVDAVKNRSVGRPKGSVSTGERKLATASDADILDLLRRDKKAAALWDGESDGYNSHSEAVFALVNKVAFYCGQPSDVERIFSIVGKSGLFSTQDEHDKWERLGRSEIEKVLDSMTDFYSPSKRYIVDRETGEVKEDTRPVVLYSPASHDVEECIRQLARVYKDKDTLFMYGGNLCKIRKQKATRRSYDAHGAERIADTQIEPIDPIATESLALAVRWEQNTVKGAKAINPPAIVIRQFAKSDHLWRFPELTGLVSAPHMRRDGSVIDVQGYDAATGLHADFAGVEYEKVSKDPSTAEIERAKMWIEDALCEFPFQDDAAKSVAIAALLTAVCRKSMQAAPLFAFDAPTPGTGKSTLASVAGIIATGVVPPATAYTQDQAEFKKMVFATLLNGSSVLLLDNIVGEVNPAAFNIILSQETFKDRVLGMSRTATVTTNMLALATGNNMSFTEDITRRIVFCTLDSKTEHPADRVFKRNIIEWTKEHRKELVWACLTILCAGRNERVNNLVPFATYEEWNNLVAKAIVALWKYPSPKTTQRLVESRDTRRGDLSALLAAWRGEVGEDWHTLADLCAIASPALLELIDAALPSHGKGSNSKSFGRYCQKYRDRPVGGLVLRQGSGGSKGKSSIWRVERMTGKTIDDLM